MKKLSALVLSLILAAGLLAGCSASASSASSEAVSSEVVSEAAPAESAAVPPPRTPLLPSQSPSPSPAPTAKAPSSTLDATDGEKLSDALAAAGVISAEELLPASSPLSTARRPTITPMVLVAPDPCRRRDDHRWRGLDIELHDGDSYAFTYTK